MISSSCGLVLKHFKNVYLSSNSMLCSSSCRKIISSAHLPLAGTACDITLFGSSRNYSSIIDNDVLLYNPSRFKQRILAPSAACKSQADARILHSLTSVVTSNKNKIEGFIKKLFKRRKYGSSTLTRSGFLLYDDISLNTDVLNFFKVMSLEDTFFSWFLVMELQVWLLSARLGAEEDDGKVVRDGLINALWQDVLAKIKELGTMLGDMIVPQWRTMSSLGCITDENGQARPNNKSSQIEELNSHFQTSLVGYDEGLMSCDRTLACAVWRNMIRREIGDPYYEGDVEDSSDDNNIKSAVDESKVNLDDLILKPKADPRALEAMVCYIRKQMYLLDQVPSENLLSDGKATWTKLEAIS